MLANYKEGNVCTLGQIRVVPDTVPPGSAPAVLLWKHNDYKVVLPWTLSPAHRKKDK
jgi:hypothetical protein